MFFLHDVFLARSITSKMTVAENRGVTPDVASDSNTVSESYWRHEQDCCADLVRQMARTCREAAIGSLIWDYQNKSIFMTGWERDLIYPIFFIIIAPADWTFPMHCSSSAY